MALLSRYLYHYQASIILDKIFHLSCLHWMSFKFFFVCLFWVYYSKNTLTAFKDKVMEKEVLSMWTDSSDLKLSVSHFRSKPGAEGGISTLHIKDVPSGIPLKSDRTWLNFILLGGGVGGCVWGCVCVWRRKFTPVQQIKILTVYFPRGAIHKGLMIWRWAHDVIMTYAPSTKSEHPNWGQQTLL